MNAEERLIVENVLGRIARKVWNEFLTSGEGAAFNQRLVLVRATLASAGLTSMGAPPLPVAELIDIYGSELLNHPEVGSWLRRALLERLSARDWDKLKSLYPHLAGQDADMLHGSMTQGGNGSRVMASYWRHGGLWARQFCDVVGLPKCLSESDGRALPEDEEIWPAEPLQALHDYQGDVYKQLRELLQSRTGTSMLSLPTGAGKTRVAVEAVCDHLASIGDNGRNVTLWIAQSEELQLQAWECFRQVWQVPPNRADGQLVKRVGPLRLLWAWGAHKLGNLELDGERTVIITGIQQLHSWVKRYPELLGEIFPKERRAAIIINEAHRLITEQHRDALLALELRLKSSWQQPNNAAPVIGLTATPWRSDDAQGEPLRSYFQTSLLRPEALGKTPICELQKRRILSEVKHENLKIKGTPAMSETQKRKFEIFHELPPDYLEVLGRDLNRNTAIIQKLRGLKKSSKALIFACSIEHAELLTLLLNRVLGQCAVVVTGVTPRGQRAAIIERFRNGDLRFLCNVSVLTTGFDAPKVDNVVITRPTWSALRYAQMVGRGLRGPKNGGTEQCLVIDVQDEGLPSDVQSYARVVQLWDGLHSDTAVS